MKISWRREKSCGTQHDRWVLLVRTWAIFQEELENHKLYYTRLKQPPELITFGIDVECIEFCYTLLVILRKNRVNTLYCWTCQISMDMTAEERKRRLTSEDELCCWLCASWDTTFLRRTLPCALVWTRALCQDYTAAGRNFWKHASMSFPFGRTRLWFRKVCQLLSRTSILTHVSSSILRRLRLTALITRYSVSDVGRLQASNFQELHHLSIHKCIATSRLVKVCTFLTTLIRRSISKKNESSRALVLDFRFYLFAFLRCIIFFLFFFSNLHFWWQYHSQLRSFVWCHWTPATMHRRRPDEFVSKL